MRKSVYSKIILCCWVLIIFSFASNAWTQVTGKVWKPLPLRTQAQKDAGMPGGEGMQMGFSISYAPSNQNIAYFVTDTEQVWKGTWTANLGDWNGDGNMESGFFWESKRNEFRSNGGISLVVDPENENVVFVSGSLHQTTTSSPIDGIYRTINGGNSWDLVYPTPYFRNHEGQHFVFDPRTCVSGVGCTTVYAATHTAGILKSINGGSSWAPLNILNNIHISDLEINLDTISNTVILYVATNDVSVSSNGLYKVTDDGFNPVAISPLGNLPDHPRTIALHPQTDPSADIIYAAVGQYKVYKSVNGGETFQEKSYGLPSFSNQKEYKVINISNACIKNPEDCPDGDYLYVSIDEYGGKNPYYSHDGGTTWTETSSVNDGISLTQGVYFASVVAPHPDNKDVALISFSGASRISKTINGGETWNYSGNGFMGADHSNNKTSAYFGPNGIKIFFLLDWGPAVTYDDGDTWGLIPVPRYNGLKSTPVGAVDPNNPDIIIAPVGSPWSQVIARSEDGGLNWTVFDGCNNCGTETYEGITVTHSAPDTEGDYNFISFGSDSNYVYAGWWKEIVDNSITKIIRGSWISSNKGVTWTKVENKDIRAIVPGNPDQVYAFEDFTENLPDICGTGLSRLWRLNNNGGTWSRVALNPFKASQINDVDFDPVANRLYVAKGSWDLIGNGGFWVYDSNTELWQTTGESKSCQCENGSCTLIDVPINEPIERESDNSQSVNAVVVDPNNPNVVYAGMWAPGYGHRQEFIYRSTDYGMTWGNFDLELGGYSKVHSLAIETVDNGSGSPQKSILHMSSTIGNYILCTDNDSDEYFDEGGACGPWDCNDNSDAINPSISDANCNGVDENCSGTADEGYTSTPTTCGVGVCSATGANICQNGEVVNTCTPGQPQTEGPFGNQTCSDGLDNNCNGTVDECKCPDNTENLLTNPGFENSPNYTGWMKLSDPAGAVTSIDNQVYYCGSKSVRVDFAGNDVNYLHVHQYGITVTPNTTYRIDGFIKTENLITSSNKGASIEVRGSGIRLALTDPLTEQNTWTYVSKEFTTGSSTTSVIVFLRRENGSAISGKAWWDDIRLVKIQ